VFEKGGYELSLMNVRIALLTTRYVVGIFGKLVYLHVSIFLFLFGFMERRHPFAYQWAKRLSDTIAERLSVDVHAVRFRPIDFLSILVVSPVFEDWAWRYLKLRRGDTFVDVGAHIGKYACVVAKLVGSQGRVVAVEAHPGNYRKLTENVESNRLSNVVLLNVAAFDRSCKVEIFEGSNSSGRSSIKLNDSLSSQIVNAKPLDDIAELESLQRIDWVKIDVEGAEYETIAGMSGLLSKHKPRLLLEAWNFPKLRPLLRRIGYTRIIEASHERGYYFLSP
jgi:FkbM family methyltransferase